MGGNKGNREKQRIVLVKFVCSAVMLSILIWVISLGWFTQNRETENEGVAGQSVNADYQIATEGNDGLYDEYYVYSADEDAKAVPVLESGKQAEFYVYDNRADDTDIINLDGGEETAADEKVTGYVSTGDNIIWKMSASSNFNNNSAATSSEISPGTWGYSDFYILPNKSGKMKISCTLSLAAYCLAGEDNTATATQIKVNDTVYNRYTYTDGDDLNKLIMGHIMLFTAEKNEDGKSELKWLAPNSNGNFSFDMDLDIDESYIKDGEYMAVRKRVYWVWVNVLGQAVLEQDALEALNGYYERISTILDDMDPDDDIITEDIVSTKMAEMMDSEDNYGYFYSNLDENKKQISSAVKGVFGQKTSTLSSADYTTLNDLWNDADQTIGKEVGFITVELSTFLNN